ncbi:EpsI family protein [Duganella sp. LX20W]|uniref:EpsI family protein n=1 Tax=Rugamonas brunnea TaxID=2758569 RepID=A0A7W2ER59_9BURK|nr:exosortase-associated protein EpsI, B-type [Rugamonas brunnea]MBA5637134.1 EpsI family protein [Rugamonas brunnea]
MNKSFAASVVLGALMISSAGLTKVVTPTVKLADSEAKFNLETAIPVAFGDWQVDRQIVPLKVDPELERKLNKLYNQTLARTYVNSDGQRIMLSIAYGGDQSEGLGLHKPEVCYVAQGFQIQADATARVDSGYGQLFVKRLMAVAGERNEPITYWITIGDKVIKPGIDQKLTQLRYGLTGVIPDGMLVRVSTLDTDTAAAYRLQDAFVRAMLQSVDARVRARLIGTIDA